MLRGYPGRPSVFPGDSIALHVACDDRESDFRAWFFRLGAEWELRGKSPIWKAQVLPSGCSTGAWGWPKHDFKIPDDWPSGPYLAMFLSSGLENTPNPDDAAHRYSVALFVVKSSPRRPASILYKLPLFTYCAYNSEGGGSLYTGPKDRVTLHRPGCGAGGDPCDSAIIDAYDMSSPRQTFAHWDAPFVRWLASNGYAADYCTDLDLHENSCALKSRRLLLSVGHDEYWSQDMRAQAESFIAGGGNAAFFSGNTCWWRVHLSEGNTTIACDKRKHSGESEAFDQWRRIDPETRLTGVSFRYGGGWWSGRRAPVGYTVQHAGHWVYGGSGLRDGDVFGQGYSEALVGYECDGAPLSTERSAEGYLLPSFADSTPATFRILGFGLLPDNWEFREQGNGAAATMGIYENCGTLFTAATTDWARVLAAGHPIVGRITRNVLGRLGSGNC